jgi:hypothetical protein
MYHRTCCRHGAWMWIRECVGFGIFQMRVVVECDLEFPKNGSNKSLALVILRRGVNFR